MGKIASKCNIYNTKSTEVRAFFVKNEGLVLKSVENTLFIYSNTCRYGKKPYLCNVFFMVLDF